MTNVALGARDRRAIAVPSSGTFNGSTVQDGHPKGMCHMMSRNGISALAATSALGLTAFVAGIATAGAVPSGCPLGARADGDACSARLTSLSAKDFELTGTPAGGTTPIDFSGRSDAYLSSTGYAGTPPDAVREWDATIAQVNDVDPTDPNWYGNGRSRAFLPTQLNQLATTFAPGTVVVRFVANGSAPGGFAVLSLQPTG